jgi:hypothetical protein
MSFNNVLETVDNQGCIVLVPSCVVPSCNGQKLKVILASLKNISKRKQERQSLYDSHASALHQKLNLPNQITRKNKKGIAHNNNNNTGHLTHAFPTLAQCAAYNTMHTSQT